MPSGICDRSLSKAEIEVACAESGDKIEWLEPISHAGYYYKVLHPNCPARPRKPIAVTVRETGISPAEAHGFLIVEMHCGTVEKGRERTNVYHGRCNECKTTFVALRD